MSEPRHFAVSAAEHRDGGWLVGIVAKRTYDVRAGQCLVSPEQVPLVETAEVDLESGTVAHDVDIVFNRRLADVVVVGKARAFPKQTSFEARLRAGTLQRAIRVFGPRRCFRDAWGALRFTEPLAIEEVDVGWGSAYGGADLAALKRYGDVLEALAKSQATPYNPRFGTFAYPRNRAGKGYLIEPTEEALELCELPNLEHPGWLLTPDRLPLERVDAWPGAPPPASFSWLSYAFFPRAAMVGLCPVFDRARFPEASFFEVQAGVLSPKSIAKTMPLAERMDFAVAQQSAIGLRAELGPGAPFELGNLHPHSSTWSFTLAREAPEMVLQVPDEAPVRLAPRIGTVLITPDLERVCVTWVGEHRQATPVGPGKLAKVRSAVKWGGT